MNIDGIEIGPDHPVYVIAEIGINHNGSLDIAGRLIDIAANAGCQAVKFQKRTVDVVYSEEELARPRESPWGKTNGDLKRGLEFGLAEYEEIDRHCRKNGLSWFASPWDVGSVEFLEGLDVCAYKVASACVTDEELLRAIGETGKPVLLSTGMSTQDEVRAAFELLDSYKVPIALMHCTSVYPCPPALCNVSAIPSYGARVMGYSGHEMGWAPTLAAVALGARVVERHITLDRSMWGSDQSASLEPPELRQMVDDIRTVDAAIGDGRKRVYEEELPTKKKLRRVG